MCILETKKSMCISFGALYIWACNDVHNKCLNKKVESTHSSSDNFLYIYAARLEFILNHKEIPKEFIRQKSVTNKTKITILKKIKNN